ncbi:unnamed protein product, partial [marine sediment metagenome]
AMGWRAGPSVYINGGVLFYNDTANARRFASVWHDKLIQCWGQRQGHLDQPALNAAVFETQPKIEILPHRFNAQINAEASVAKDATL